MSDQKSRWWAGLFGASRRKTEAPRAAEAGERAEAAAAGEAALAEVLAIVEELVQQHGSTLVAKRRQKTYRDDYGRLVDDAWQSEIDYFRENIVEAELARRCGEQKRAEALIHVVGETPQEVREAIGDPELYYAIRISACIAVLVEELDATTPAQMRDADDLTPASYEHLCAEALREAGWAVRVCGGSGDQGVDIVAEAGDIRAVFQCKLYASPVGNGAVQEVYTGRTFHGAQLAAVVSTAGFTPAARAAAAQTGVFLLHHSQLAEFPKGM